MSIPSYTRQTDDVDWARADCINPVYDHVEYIASASAHAQYASTAAMTGDITLTDSSDPVQSLDPNGADRNVTLPAVGSKNHAFYFWNRSTGSNTLTIKASGGTTVVSVSAGSAVFIVPDGTNGWVAIGSSGGGGSSYPSVVEVSSTSYTTSDSDNGKILKTTNSSATTITIHSSAAAGFSVLIAQWGSGQVTLAASGGNVRNYDGHTKLAGQYASGTAVVISNAGSAPEVLWQGRTAA